MSEQVKMDVTGRMDWQGLMRAGMRGLGLKPTDFWALSPAELAMMLGVEANSKLMTRSRLKLLTERYPDQQQDR